MQATKSVIGPCHVDNHSLWLLGTLTWPIYSFDYRDRSATLATNGQFSMPLRDDTHISYWPSSLAASLLLKVSLKFVSLNIRIVTTSSIVLDPTRWL